MVELVKGPALETDLDAARPMGSLFKLAMRQRGLFLGILALAGLSSLLLLLQPLLYREAVNDVAGVFVTDSAAELVILSRFWVTPVWRHSSFLTLNVDID
jgi:hypothetical protein